MLRQKENSMTNKLEDAIKHIEWLLSHSNTIPTVVDREAIAELLKNAKRYQWLRDLDVDDYNNWICNAPGEWWDHEIDSAMAGIKKEI